MRAPTDCALQIARDLTEIAFVGVQTDTPAVGPVPAGRTSKLTDIIQVCSRDCCV